MTSHDVVAVLRRVTKIRQIGHTGTLDPFAEGVLPVCIGKATRLIEYFADDKEYLATVQFGSATTTYDIEGQKTFISDRKITADDIDKFSGVTSKKNKLNHLNAFLLSGIKSGIIKNTNKDFLISLLPEIYREIGRKIAE